MHVHIIQHVPFETPGCITAWAGKHEVPYTVLPLYENKEFPPPHTIDTLVVMGGPMGVQVLIPAQEFKKTTFLPELYYNGVT